jgi:hypothetical protein
MTHHSTPKEMAEAEGKALLQKKQDMWILVVKEDKFKLVEEYDDKTKEDIINVPETPLTPSFKFVSPLAPYHFFANIPDPSKIKAKKDWKPGTWRIRLSLSSFLSVFRFSHYDYCNDAKTCIYAPLPL